MIKILICIINVLLTLATIGCSSIKPIVKKDDRYYLYGKTRVDEEIQFCLDEADEMINNNALKDSYYVGADGVVSSLSSSLSQAIQGQGNFANNMALGSIRTSSQIAKTGVSTIREKKVDPKRVKRNFVIICLAKKNLIVTGWQ